MKKTFAALGITVFLGACATAQQGSQPTGEASQGTSLQSVLSKSVDAVSRGVSNGLQQQGLRAAPASASQAEGGRIHLRDTDLKNIIGKSTSADWPRIAVTINNLPKWFYGMPPSRKQGIFSPRDCMNVSITAWTSATKSKTYDRIDFCGDDIVYDTPFSDVGLGWRSFGMASGKNTGAQRTSGPTPPAKLFPNKPGVDSFFLLNGNYFLGSLMATLGYNWQEPQDARFWVVTAPTQAETVHQ